MTTYSLNFVNTETIQYVDPIDGSNVIHTFNSIALEYRDGGIAGDVLGSLTKTTDGTDDIYTLDNHDGFMKHDTTQGITLGWTFEGTLPLNTNAPIVSPNASITGYDENVAGNAFILDANNNLIEVSKLKGFAGTNVSVNEDGIATVTTFDTENASLTGTTSVEDLEVTNDISAGSATLTGAVSAGSATVSGNLSAANLTVTGTVSLPYRIFDDVASAEADVANLKGQIFYIRG